jgi:hypothetical protein
MAEHTMRSGDVVFIDDSDAHLMVDGNWCIQKVGHLKYAFRVEGRGRVYLHRLITDACNGYVVDHINGNGLDNRRENLRVCTLAQNLQNRKRAKHAIHPYKGVSKSRHGRWEARIGGTAKNAKVKRQRLGAFNTIEEAAAAYDIAAVLMYGEFCCLNFPHVFPEVSSRKA